MFAFSLEADGCVHTRGCGAVVEPTRRDGFGLRIELYHLFAVGAEIAELGAARAGKAEDGHGYGNRHVDAHLPDVDLVLKLACNGAALGKYAGAVAERIVVHQRDGLVQGVDPDDDHHRSEYLGGVDLHPGRYAGENRGSDEIALVVARHLDGAAVQLELGAFLDAVLHQPENALFRVFRDHGAEIRAFFNACIDLERLCLRHDVRDPLPCVTHQYGDGGGHAALTCGAEGRSHYGVQRLLFVGVR